MACTAARGPLHAFMRNIRFVGFFSHAVGLFWHARFRGVALPAGTSPAGSGRGANHSYSGSIMPLPAGMRHMRSSLGEVGGKSGNLVCSSWDSVSWYSWALRGQRISIKALLRLLLHQTLLRRLLHQRLVRMAFWIYERVSGARKEP